MDNLSSGIDHHRWETPTMPDRDPATNADAISLRAAVRARYAAAASAVENVRFLKGEIEQVPLPDTSVDVVISNCVINLSTDKAKVLREAFRVLRPGGRFAVSDVVVQGELPALVRKSVELWAG